MVVDRDRDGTRENGCADQIRVRSNIGKWFIYTQICFIIFGAPIIQFEAGVSPRQRAKIDKNLFEIIKSRLPGEQNM